MNLLAAALDLHHSARSLSLILIFLLTLTPYFSIRPRGGEKILCIHFTIVLIFIHTDVHTHLEL